MGILPQTNREYARTQQKIVRRMMSATLKLVVATFVLILAVQNCQGGGYGKPGRMQMHGGWRQQSGKQLPDIGGLFKKKIDAKKNLLSGLVSLKKSLLSPLVNLKKSILTPILGLKRGLIQKKAGLVKGLLAPIAGIKKAKLSAVRGILDKKIGLLGSFGNKGGSSSHHGSYRSSHRGWN